MSYNGIGATDPNHPLEVEGQVFVSDVELGNATQDVPFEVYSDYTAKATLTDSRQLRLRVTPSATTTSTSHIDMGIDNVTGNVFFISQPVFDATTAGDRNVFTIERGGNVSIGNNLTISSNIQTGNLAVTSNISTGNVSITDNLTVSGDTSVTGTLTTGDITGDTSLAISGDVSMANDLSVTGTITTSNIVGGSPLTISTASNVQILTSNVGIGTVPLSNTRVHIQGGSTASITNSNVFPNFVFSRNANASLNHVGSAHNAARAGMLPDEDGRVWAVGNNAQGGLGLGDTTSRNKYTLVNALEGVANIVASSTSGYSGDSDWEQTILLDDTGNVWTCGQNTQGQLGQDDSNARYIPTLVTINIYSGVSITEVSCGTGMALALDSTGQIWGCGANANQYRAGNLSDVTSNIYTFVPSMPDGGPHVFDSIDAGWQHSLALENDGRIWSTGANLNGRTGQGTDTGTTAGWTLCPDGTTSDQSISTVSITQISVGESHSIARDSTGNVWVTGYNNNGQLGLGDSTDRNIFERVTSNVNVNQGVTSYKIAAGVGRSYVLDTNGRMWGCGYNVNGEFGNPPYTATISTFTRADAGPIANKSITDFALSGYGSPIVRTSDNEYWVTGFNEFGQLGTGDTQNRLAYTKLLDFNATPPPDYGYTRSLLLENTETGKGPSIEFKNSDAVSSRIQMEDGASGKLNIGFVDASFDPKLSGGDGAQLYPFQERAQSNTMTRGVTINQAGGTMVAGGSTSNVGFNTPIFSSGLPGTANYGRAASFWYSGASLFVTTEGKVYVGGDNVDGSSGDGTTGDAFVWKESTPASSYPIVAFSAGNAYNIVLDAKGQLWGSGRNTYGQLGVGDTDNRTTWTAVSGTGNQAVACGYEATYRITDDSTLEACGRGLSYRLGTGNQTDQSSFVASTSGDLGSSKVKSVWGNSGSAFVIRADDVLLAVGNNGDAHLGVGTAGVDVQTWTAVTDTNFSGETPVQLSSIYDGGADIHAMMVTAEGNIYGCGASTYYQTGLNSTTDVSVFTQCTGDIRNVTVTRVSTTRYASICLDSTGNVWITGRYVANGNPSDDDNTEFTKVTLPAEFYSKTIVNVMGGHDNTFYAVDSEGTLWGVGSRIRGLGQVGSPGYVSKLFTKVPIYDVVPKSFQYTPTLTLENPNADHGATIEFKNPNNRAFINLDDKTSTLRLGFVDNENNAGQFKGIGIEPGGSFSEKISIVNTADITTSAEVLRLQRGDGTNDLKSNTRGTIGLYLRDDNVGGGEVARISWGHDGGDADPEGKGRLGFWTSDTGAAEGVPVERMTIRASGRVGIGTATPSHPLHVNGVIRFGTNTSGSYVYSENISVGSTDWVNIPFTSGRGSFMIMLTGVSNDQACLVGGGADDSGFDDGIIYYSARSADYNTYDYLELRWPAGGGVIQTKMSASYTRTVCATVIRGI